jgi:acyl carrier protein
MTSDQVVEQIAQTVGELLAAGQLPGSLGGSVVSADARFDELGMDSIVLTSLLLALEGRLGSPLDSLKLGSVQTVRELADEIVATRGTAGVKNERTQIRPTESRLTFNVLPDREVSETLTLRSWATMLPDRIEGVFDREYRSGMRQSPDHLVVLSALVQSQKLLYLLLCERFHRPTDLDKPESLKIWPFDISIQMPELIRQRNGLIQRIQIQRFEETGKGRYLVDVESVVERSMIIRSRAVVIDVE